MLFWVIWSDVQTRVWSKEGGTPHIPIEGTGQIFVYLLKHSFSTHEALLKHTLNSLETLFKDSWNTFEVLLNQS